MAATKRSASRVKPPPAKARATRTVSPARGMPVAEWIRTKADGWRATTVKRLLAIARAAVPDAEQAIKWN